MTGPAAIPRHFACCIKCGGLLLALTGPGVAWGQGLAPAVQWEARLGGRYQNQPTALLPTADGGYLVAGMTNSPAGGDVSQSWRGADYSWEDGDNYPGRIKDSFDFWVIKTDAGGHKRWDARFGGNYGDKLGVARQTADGGYLLAGTSASDAGGDLTQPSRSPGHADLWVVRINAGGTLEWQARFGGNATEELVDLWLTADGGFLLAGNTNSAAGHDISQGPAGKWDFWVVKANARGERQWDARVGTAAETRSLRACRPTADGGLLLLGAACLSADDEHLGSPAGSTQVLALKLSAAGTREWESRAPYPYCYWLDAYAVSETRRGYQVEGYARMQRKRNDTPEHWTLTLRPDGSRPQLKHRPDSSFREATAVLPTRDGGRLIGLEPGDKSHLADNQDFRLEQRSAAGHLQWAARYGDRRRDVLRCLQPTADGGYLLGGTTFTGVMQEAEFATQGLTDIWLVKLAAPAPGVPAKPARRAGRPQ